MGFQKCFLPPPPTSLSEVKLEFVGILFVAIIFHCTIENLIYVSCNLKQFSTIFGSLIGWGSSLNICKIYRRIGCKFLQPQYLKKKKNFIFCLRSSKTEIWLLSLLSPGRCQFNWNRISHSKRNSKTKIFENPEVIKLISLLRKRNTLTTNKQKKKKKCRAKKRENKTNAEVTSQTNTKQRFLWERTWTSPPDMCSPFSPGNTYRLWLLCYPGFASRRNGSFAQNLNRLLFFFFSRSPPPLPPLLPLSLPTSLRNSFLCLTSTFLQFDSLH